MYKPLCLITRHWPVLTVQCHMLHKDCSTFLLQIYITLYVITRIKRLEVQWVREKTIFILELLSIDSLVLYCWHVCPPGPAKNMNLSYFSVSSEEERDDCFRLKWSKFWTAHRPKSATLTWTFYIQKHSFPTLFHHLKAMFYLDVLNNVPSKHKGRLLPNDKATLLTTKKKPSSVHPHKDFRIASLYK